MRKFLKSFSEQNPEKFNKEFIMSRSDENIVSYIRDIFKATEILDEIKVLDVQMETDESNFLPAINDRQYYKPILQSRLNKIKYKLQITPSEDSRLEPILVDEFETFNPDDFKKTPTASDSSFIIEREIYINKLIDKSFYINEGIRYFLIYQIVDNSTYGTRNAVSLKSLLMPITIMKRKSKLPTEMVSDAFSPEKKYSDFPSYDTLLFAKRVNPILYVMGKYAYNSLVTMKIKNESEKVHEIVSYKDESLLTKLNSFFNVDIKVGNSAEELKEDSRTVLKINKGKDTKNCWMYISVDTEKFEKKDQDLMAFLGSFLSIHNKEKKNNMIFFSSDDLKTPYFWINKLADFFTKNSDPIKRFEKIKTMLISLDRLMDDATRKILDIADNDKKNTLTIIRYIMRNFDKLSQEDNQDLNNKRIRMYEYQLYPLRKYLSDQIYRVLNSTTRSKIILERMFSNLNPMFVIKQTIVNELLRYYNSTNEINLYACLLKFSFRGPQSINRTVSISQRDLHESYTGRLSLVASNASDPGLSGTIVPFVKLYDYFFKRPDYLKEGD